MSIPRDSKQISWILMSHWVFFNHITIRVQFNINLKPKHLKHLNILMNDDPMHSNGQLLQLNCIIFLSKVHFHHCSLLSFFYSRRKLEMISDDLVMAVGSWQCHTNDCIRSSYTHGFLSFNKNFIKLFSRLFCTY